jgi:hypothetical protein
MLKVCVVAAMFWLSSVHAEQIQLTNLSRLELKNAQASNTTHQGKSALKLTEGEKGQAEAFAAVKDIRFRNGTIELEVSGAPLQTAPDSARGFVGVAFRMQPGGSRFEYFYIRPTNGRADDQLRRNHATQYASFPDWPWQRLRQETPGVYESYADMSPGEWTRLRIIVQGTKASLYVGGVAQPCLIVHDLKLGDVEGSVALWIGPGTEGYFRDLTISK